MDIVPALRPRLAETLEALRAEGILPTDAEVVWLAQLRERCDAPRVDDGTMLGAPLDVAGETWWPLHMLAEDWFWHAYQELGERGDWRTWAYLFAHTRSAPGDKSLLLVMGPVATMAAVGSWRRRCALHREVEGSLVGLLRELDGYVETVVDPDRVKEEIAPRPKPMAGVAALCRMFPGTNPDYWRAGISARETDALLSSEKSAETDRTQAIRNYLTAVRVVRRNHGQ